METSFRNILSLVLIQPKNHVDLDFLKSNFAGSVCSTLPNENQLIIYFGGDASCLILDDVTKYQTIFIIKELSYNLGKFESSPNLITLGRVPMNVHGVGIFFREFFDAEKDIFSNVQSEHQFQNLTESNKQSSAFRTGLYLSQVTQIESDTLQFHLLRCSSNFTGPTENFRETDHRIIDTINGIAEEIFEKPAKLNHVLAQIYHNTDKGKAKIKSHADKTKDMPRNGIMAFCTFYQKQMHSGIKRSDIDPYDLTYKNKSVLTSLRFRLKSSDNKFDLPHDFKIKLYPNSVFLMPLSSNRIYTHEISPSILPFEYIPLRMGYVIRCSKTVAIHKDGYTFVRNDNGDYRKLEAPTDADLDQLRKKYYQENTTDDFIDYGDVYFSMNQGDYMKPIV